MAELVFDCLWSDASASLVDCLCWEAEVVPYVGELFAWFSLGEG